MNFKFQERQNHSSLLLSQGRIDTNWSEMEMTQIDDNVDEAPLSQESSWKILYIWYFFCFRIV